jgi:hypothetical protein
MATEPYVKSKPGDLITAENMNLMQIKISDDIQGSISKALAALTSVPKSADTEKFGGKTPEEYASEIVKQAVSQLNQKTGYRRLYRRLRKDDELVYEHKLGDAPLVDVYQLEYYEVVSSEDGTRTLQSVLFFLYHKSEQSIRFKLEPPPTSGSLYKDVYIEPPGETAFRIPWYELLAFYGVKYTDSTSLDQLEENFWEAFFRDPNETFDDNQTAHSPWFDRCCGEKRTVGELKSSGAWESLYLKVKPVKTINLPEEQADNPPRPPRVQVRHFSLNTLGLKPVAPPSTGPIGLDPNTPGAFNDELPVMILLKV